MSGQHASVKLSQQTLRGVDRWGVVAASVPGLRHHQRGQPCQDAHYWRIVHDEVLIAAVADGAGSAALGKVGATLAACAAVTFIGAESRPSDWPDSAADWRQWLVDALHTAQATVQAEARARQVPVRVLATTLILVVALPTCVAVAQIGDGAVVVGDMGGQLLPLTVPQSGEYPNETTFLTSPHALDTAQVCVWSGLPRHIAAFSDGLQRLALHMPDGHPHVPFFLPFLRVMETVTEVGTVQTQVEAFLRSQRIRERTDDDITLVLGTFRRAGDDAGAVSL